MHFCRIAPGFAALFASIMLFSTPAGADDFATLFAHAETFHESIGGAKARAEQAVRERDKVKAKLLPRLSLEASIRRRQEAKTSLTGGVIQTRETRQMTVRLGQTLYTGGRASTQLKIATIGAEAGQLGVYISREALIFSVAQAYFDVIKAKDDLATASARLSGMRQQKQAVTLRVKLGADVRAAALRISAEVAALEAQELAAQNALASNREILASLTGKLPENPLGSAPDLSVVRDMKTPQEIALATRSDLHLLAGEELATALGIQYTTGAFLPSVDLEARYQKQAQDPSVFFLTDEDATLTLNATWDLYSGGENLAERARARAAHHEKQLAYQQLARDIRLQVSQADRAVNTVTQQVGALQQALTYAAENHRIVSETYKAGAATYLDVIDASTALGDARLNLAHAHYDHNLALLVLAQATGYLVSLIGETPQNDAELSRQRKRLFN